MNGTIQAFFERLAKRGYEPLLHSVSGTIREFPVEYPTASSPQAWASGAPLLLLRAILGLEPIGNNLLVDPAIPSMLGQLELLDIPGRWGRIDAFGRGRVDTMAGKNSEF
jgi:glycogen debranching enzyme